MGGSLQALNALLDGIPVPEYGVVIPWLIREADLRELIPEGELILLYRQRFCSFFNGGGRLHSR